MTGLAVGGEAEWWRAVLDGAGDVWDWCSEFVVRWAVACGRWQGFAVLGATVVGTGVVAVGPAGRVGLCVG